MSNTFLTFDRIGQPRSIIWSWIHSFNSQHHGPRIHSFRSRRRWPRIHFSIQQRWPRLHSSIQQRWPRILWWVWCRRCETGNANQRYKFCSKLIEIHFHCTSDLRAKTIEGVMKPGRVVWTDAEENFMIKNFNDMVTGKKKISTKEVLVAPAGV